MKRNRKGLQKLTESDAKINKIASLKQITPNDLKSLTKFEKRKLFDIINDKINSSKGEERDQILEKIEPITGIEMKNQLWEYNHQRITASISNLMQNYNRMPTMNEIVDECGLSRQTIHKHLKEYMNHPLYLEHIRQFKYSASIVLAQIYKLALNGDMKAAKLYFNIIGGLNSRQFFNNTFIQNQNNYIYINGILFDQEAVKFLNPEQLNTVEAILKAALPKSKLGENTNHERRIE
jgi:predicted DNA-binding protein YlxM (UPF0122 family)